MGLRAPIEQGPLGLRSAIGVHIPCLEWLPCTQGAPLFNCPVQGLVPKQDRAAGYTQLAGYGMLVLVRITLELVAWRPVNTLQFGINGD